MAFIQNLIDDIKVKRSYRRYLEREDRKRRITSQIFSIVAFVSGIYYLVWVLVYANLKSWFMFSLFFIAEAVTLLSFGLICAVTWYKRFHNPEGIESKKQSSVDVFVTVSNEPFEIVSPTLEAAVKLQYPNKQVYVLDDGSSIKLKLLSAKLGCRYLNRGNNLDNKAGNLNYGLSNSSGELVFVLDADQVCQPDALNKLIGYFSLPKIAFVQSAQNFKVSENDPFINKEMLFYGSMQCGKDTDSAAFSCGSACLYRRNALDEINRFSTWNLVEDLHTSLRLHEKGWRSVYYDYPLSFGTAPENIWDYYKQRQQWCTDSVRMMLWDNPLFKKSLSFKQKLQYFHTGFSYIVSAFIMPIFYIIPIWSFLTGNFLVNGPIAQYVGIRLAFLALAQTAHILNNYPYDVLKPSQMWSGSFPAFIYGSLVALFSPRSKPRYRINPKTNTNSKSTSSALLAILPQLLVILLLIVSGIYAFVNKTCSAALFTVNALWSIWIVWLLYRICDVSLKKS